MEQPKKDSCVVNNNKKHWAHYFCLFVQRITNSAETTQASRERKAANTFKTYASPFQPNELHMAGNTWNQTMYKKGHGQWILKCKDKGQHANSLQAYITTVSGSLLWGGAVVVSHH